MCSCILIEERGGGSLIYMGPSIRVPVQCSGESVYTVVWCSYAYMVNKVAAGGAIVSVITMFKGEALIDTGTW